MRHIAVHDLHGTIVMLSSGPADGPPPPIALEPGYEATEVELAEMEIGLDPSAADSEKLAKEVMGTFRVDLERRGRLVRREGA